VDGDAYQQAKRCFEVVIEAVEGLGGSREDIVRTRMYLTEAADWDAVGRAHGEVFREVYPAATMVVVAALLDPRWKIEVEADAELEE
jgi:enamine deaminase RidA (YjgF/YER057c/UK114 family)